MRQAYDTGRINQLTTTLKRNARIRKHPYAFFPSYTVAVFINVRLGCNAHQCRTRPYRCHVFHSFPLQSKRAMDTLTGELLATSAWMWWTFKMTYQRRFFSYIFQWRSSTTATRRESCKKQARCNTVARKPSKNNQPDEYSSNQSLSDCVVQTSLLICTLS